MNLGLLRALAALEQQPITQGAKAMKRSIGFGVGAAVLSGVMALSGCSSELAETEPSRDPARAAMARLISQDPTSMPCARRRSRASSALRPAPTASAVKIAATSEAGPRNSATSENSALLKL